jgi:predicted TIM-barrel enzyme
MTPAAAAKLIEEARAMLSQERAMILSGRYDDLHAAAEKRESRLSALSQAAESTLAALRPQIAGLRAAAERNQALLKAALDGVDAARRRIAAVNGARAKLATYGPDGAPVVKSYDKSTGRRA